MHDRIVLQEQPLSCSLPASVLVAGDRWQCRGRRRTLALVDVVRLGDPQGPEAAQGKLGDLAADLVADLRSIVRMLAAPPAGPQGSLMSLPHHLERSRQILGFTRR